MRFISPLLKHVVYPGLSSAGYLRHSTGAGPTVLTYHGVLPAGYTPIDPDLDGSLVSADSFRQQLRFVKQQYNAISPQEFLLWCESGRKLPPRSVLLTCDDGLRNSLTDMLPILREFDLPCLFFVTGASLADTPTMLWYEELYMMFLAAPESFTVELLEIGLNACTESRKEKRILWWVLVRKLSGYDFGFRQAFLERIRMQLGLTERWDDEYREDPVLSRRFLVTNRTELCELAATEGAAIGAHTMSHPVLSRSSPQTAWTEVTDCKLGLEHALDRNVWALAYPFGDPSSVTSREMQMAERAGYRCAFVNVGGSFGAKIPRYALPRMHIAASMTMPEFEAHLSGFHRSLQQLFRPANPHAAMGAHA
jgi:peptidoglycan/xylan/chitin deacetylase (PgdA/CDA1 family)